jgi:hypothetical protein
MLDSSLFIPVILGTPLDTPRSKETGILGSKTQLAHAGFHSS